MDAAGGASDGLPIKPNAALVIVIIFFVLLNVCGFSQAQTNPEILGQLKELSSASRWQDVLNLAVTVGATSSEVDFYVGTAFGHLDRWSEAQKAFSAGAQLDPRDKRFPQELGGIAFKQKRYADASKFLQRALRLDASDSYTLDFLGTVYFIDGNLEAALKYWNRIGKPQIEKVIADPVPRLNPALLDQSFAFAPNSKLLLAELLSSEARVNQLGIFPTFHFELQAQPNENWDLIFRNSEKNGCGGKLECIFSIFRGLPAQSVYPEFFNLRQRDNNFLGYYRWDAQKRRVDAEWSAPFGAGPKHHYDVSADLRDENWDIRNSFTGYAPLLGSLKLRRQAIAADFVSIESGRWNWSAAGEFSHRSFGDVFPGVSLTPEIFAAGYELKQTTRIGANLWRIPERRLTVEGEASSQLGRIWSSPYYTFDKLRGSAGLHWFPKQEGDDYELQDRLKGGKTLGTVPFDELSTMGVLGDAGLLMRAHIATRDGRKGSAPLGSDYFLNNWEMDKNVYAYAPFAVKVGPFVDTGKITDPSPGLGSHKWLWDVGAQLKVKVFGTGVAVAYGKDLRSGNNAITVRLESGPTPAYRSE